MARYGYEFRRPRDERIGPTTGARHRMGMHDFSEHYGRYSGGPSYAYEYSERTIEHRHRGGDERIGFTRRLRPRPRRRVRRGRERPYRRRRRGAWY